jgi:putative SOS response-associated peptidase YedK
MCGRYRLSRRAEVLATYYAEYEGVDWDARYNIAPTRAVPVIRQEAEGAVRRASLMRWGLVPSWAKDATGGARMINARSETAAEKPAFRELLQRRRCLIPADGFYEWQRSGKSKQPYCFEMASGEPFAFAGLWDSWQAPDGSNLETCTILTTAPNQLLADIHDRMPVILPPESYEAWLDPRFRGVAEATAMLKPFDAGMMRRYVVGTRVNNVANDDPDCSARIEPSMPIQAVLFQPRGLRHPPRKAKTHNPRASV